MAAVFSPGLLVSLAVVVETTIIITTMQAVVEEISQATFLIAVYSAAAAQGLVAVAAAFLAVSPAYSAGRGRPSLWAP